MLGSWLTGSEVGAAPSCWSSNGVLTDCSSGALLSELLLSLRVRGGGGVSRGGGEDFEPSPRGGGELPRKFKNPSPPEGSERRGGGLSRGREEALRLRKSSSSGFPSAITVSSCPRTRGSVDSSPMDIASLSVVVKLLLGALWVT